MKIIKFNKELKKILTMVCIISFISISISYANIIENFNFKNITIEDGLSQSTVKTIYQDSRGYIWVGTDAGLNKYNGYEFKQYKHDEYNKNSISDNYIIDIAEDKNGRIWISTINGLTRIDTDKDEIKNYYSEKDNGNLLNSNRWRLLTTKEGKLIVFGINGVNLYDEEKDTFNSIALKENNLNTAVIYSEEEDSNGHIWVGTDKGLVELDKNLNLIKSYEDTIGEVEVYNIYDDLKGNLWVCTLGNGLFRINLNDKSIKNYKNSRSASSILSNNIRDVISDSKGKLWIATDIGLCSFDYKTEEFISYNKKTNESDTLINGSILCLFKDKSGLIWIGTHNGIATFNPDTKFSHFKSDPYDSNSISGDSIYGIYKDDDNLLWLGTSEQGVNIINEKEVKYLHTENSNLLSNTIIDITGYENKVFIGTNNGLSVLVKDNESYTITNYTEKEGLPSNKITYLFVDSKGSLFIGTSNGLAILDSNNKLIDVTYILDDIGVSDKFIGAIYEDSRENYYIGCFLGGGLIKINPNTKEYKIYKNIDNDETSLSNDCIIFINENLDGNILVGTSYGLNILDVNKDTFKRYTEKDGLINNTIYGILVDDSNKIWISTNEGISALCTKKNDFENFTIIDGLQSNEFNGRSCFKDNNGTMYFGGINGFNTFNPDNIEISQFKPNITIDSVQVNGVNRKDISNTKLKHNEHNIKINFFANDYTNTKTTKFYYKLDGLSDNWTLTQNNSIEFVNLPAGDYTLRIKAKTRHGVEGEENILKFTIKPPFWKSNIAMCLYILLIMALVIKNKYKVKKLDKLVNERTKDLRVQMDKNEALFKKVLMLEQNKNIYFVNLSHELRTPLNILTSINQLIKDLCKKEVFITPEKLSYYMNIMERNNRRLLNLINNIIDNSKIENNNYILTKTDENIVYLVEDTVLDMKDYIEEKGIELIFDTDVEEKIVRCGKTEIERCIINLVGNAVKFTPKGGLIEVTIKDLDDKVQISVKDNGIGISEENKKLIFDRFNQVVDENAEVKGGSGLGLTISKQLITLHGGHIYVESEVGIGSEFIIILPANNH